MSARRHTEGIRVADRVLIPLRELHFDFSRSSGPGGQNVNKVSTRVVLRFDVNASAALSDDHRRLIHHHLRTRINRDGILRVVAAANRSQAANRRAAIERFAELLGEAIRPIRDRKPTMPGPGVRQARLRDKERRSRIKRLRAAPPTEEA